MAEHTVVAARLELVLAELELVGQIGFVEHLDALAASNLVGS